jgi:hypothetical protein
MTSTPGGPRAGARVFAGWAQKPWFPATSRNQSALFFG